MALHGLRILVVSVRSFEAISWPLAVNIQIIMIIIKRRRRRKRRIDKQCLFDTPARTKHTDGQRDNSIPHTTTATTSTANNDNNNDTTTTATTTNNNYHYYYYYYNYYY